MAAHLDDPTITRCAAGDAEVEKVLREAPPAVSLALGESGELLGEPIQDEESILCVDVDASRSIAPKMAHDVVCGYQRFDVFDFHLDRRRHTTITVHNAHSTSVGMAERPANEPEEEPSEL